MLSFAESLDHVGPMPRTAGDVAIVFDAIARRDPNDATSLDALEEALRGFASRGAQIVDVRMPAATYPSHASEYGPYMRDFLAEGARVAPEHLAQARTTRLKLSAQFAAVVVRPSLLSSAAFIGNLGSPETSNGMIVDDPHRLHPGVDNCRPNELEAPMLHVRGDARGEG